jgi:AraC family transcriptional regulator
MAQRSAHLAFHGLEIGVRRFGGARALRVIHPGGQRIGAHRHDWPLLTIPALGGYDEEYEDGSVAVSGPAVVLHPPGRCHANCIHERGMETITIEFDASWLRTDEALPALQGSHVWKGGAVVLAARALAREWHDPAATEVKLQQATAAFLVATLGRKAKPAPKWFERAAARIASDPPATANDLAVTLGLHPRWFAHAYRSIAGEGLQETVMRRRTEQAVHLLRTTDQPIAQVALATGFCDQSHMNRVIRHLTGRTPARVRAERDELRLVVEKRRLQAVS